MTKDLLFDDYELNLLSQKFKILSEPSRLKIIRALFNRELCVKEIIKETGLLQANVSKQLQILANNKIVQCRPKGLQRFYRVIDHTIIDICKSICKSNNTN